MDDLQGNELRLREHIHALKQAEEDVKNMASIIEKLKTQNKQKEKLIWEREMERNDSDMQLQETLLELKRVQDVKKILSDDLAHLKERLSAVEDRSQYTDEINRLKEELNCSLKAETNLKKEFATLKYKLETSTNDSEAKISDLLKQLDHYTKVVEMLNNEKDAISLAEKELYQKYEALNTECESLKGKIGSLTKIKQELESDLNQKTDALQISNAALSSSTQKNKEITEKSNIWRKHYNCKWNKIQGMGSWLRHYRPAAMDIKINLMMRSRRILIYMKKIKLYKSSTPTYSFN